MIEVGKKNIFVGDGHSGQGTNATPDTVSRIVKFDSEGTFLASIGHWGAGPGEFKTPHALDIDSRGRLVVGDRGNNRLQVLDLDGNRAASSSRMTTPSSCPTRNRRSMRCATQAGHRQYVSETCAMGRSTT